MSDITQDIRHGARVLLKSPRFTIVAVLTLALGIGGGTAVFSIVEARLFRPLPFERPHELVWFMQNDPSKGAERVRLSGPNFVDLKAQATSLEQIAAFHTDDKTVRLPEGGSTRVEFLMATPEIFPILGIQASEGRTFRQTDGVSAAMISPRFRRVHFGDQEAVIGRTLITADGLFEIVGVLRETVQFPPGPAEFAPDIWALLDPTSPAFANRAPGRLIAVGRLRDGATLEQARTELKAIMARLAQAYPQTNENAGAIVGPLSEFSDDTLRRESPVLLAAIGFVLLIGCANIANLLLARLSSRRSEMSVRMALGASRGRLVRQMLTESLLLAAAGWAAGLPLAYWGARLLSAMTPARVALVGDVEIDGRVLAFSLLATLLSGLLFGVAPALALSPRSLSANIRAGGRSLAGGQDRLRSTLIAAEITLSLVSLVAAGLMLRGLVQAMVEFPGFNPDRLLTFRISSPPSGQDGLEGATTFYGQALERVSALPGVRSTAVASHLPMSTGGDSVSFRVAGRVADAAREPEQVGYQAVSAGYFRTMESPLLEGRPFQESDNPSAARVAIVNQSFVKRFLDGTSALGNQLILRSGATVEIVGVAAGEKYQRMDAQPEPAIYVPFAQFPSGTVEFAVRAEKDAAGMVDAVRAEVAAMDPSRPLYSFQLMEERIDTTLAAPRFTTVLLGLFAALGLMLAGIGVYGVMAHAVAERTREIGLRAALGASRGAVLLMVFSRGAKLVGAGLAVGVGAALVTSELLRRLYDFRGVSPHDPATFGIAIAVLIIAGFLACYVPARRAARIEPMEALRNE